MEIDCAAYHCHVMTVRTLPGIHFVKIMKNVQMNVEKIVDKVEMQIIVKSRMTVMLLSLSGLLMEIPAW